MCQVIFSLTSDDEKKYLFWPESGCQKAISWRDTNGFDKLNPTSQEVSHLIMPLTVTSIRLHTYCDRARLSESVVYEYNRRIDRLRAWPW